MMKILWVCAVAALVAACGDDGGDAGSNDVVDATSHADAALDATVDVRADAGDAEDTGGDDVDEIACPEPTGARPAARAEHAGVYDVEGERLVLFGGSFGVPENCSAIVDHTYERDTWVFDARCEQWRRLDDEQIQGRVRHSAVYDSRERRMLVYGGRHRDGSSGPYTLPPEVMALDLETETWSALPTTGDPPGRFNHAAAYDAEAHRMLVFGGNLSTSGVNYIETDEIWALDLETLAWAEVTPAAGDTPAPRFWVSGAWDADRRWFVIYAGTNAAEAFNPQASYFDDLWALDLTADPPAWYRLDLGVGQAPLGRFWAGLAHDPGEGEYVVFGGHDDGNLGNRNDLWRIDPVAGEWRLGAIGDTFNAPPRGFCDFPPDFATVDPDAPERRHAQVFAPAPDGAWLTGGKTDCGNVDDVYFYDFADDAWREIVPATVGEACLRQGGVGCTDMCF